jgi:hypothetical protein
MSVGVVGEGVFQGNGGGSCGGEVVVQVGIRDLNKTISLA